MIQRQSPDNLILNLDVCDVDLYMGGRGGASCVWTNLLHQYFLHEQMRIVYGPMIKPRVETVSSLRNKKEKAFV